MDQIRALAFTSHGVPFAGKEGVGSHGFKASCAASAPLT